ncbi:MAG: hypothetical protein Q4G59_10235 [Planctomycetia bacterium]|nr:hypothetical protein [Planctomycetia bacterium]
MASIVEWLEDFSTFMVEDELERLEKYELPEGAEDIISNMNKAMSNFDYDETARLAKTLL